MSTIPEQPFSTILALSIMKLVRAHDIRLNQLRHNYFEENVTIDGLGKLIETEDIRLSEDVLDTCRRTLATLESTVDSVLKIQGQMQQLRDLEAQRMPLPTS